VVRRTGTNPSSDEPETAYYISNLPATPNRLNHFADLIRGHWAACEIRNHWVRDHIFGEDKTRSKNRKINANLAILRVAILALKEHLMPHLKWPQIVESAQADSAFAYQLVVNHRLK